MTLPATQRAPTNFLLPNIRKAEADYTHAVCGTVKRQTEEFNNQTGDKKLFLETRNFSGLHTIRHSCMHKTCSVSDEL